jgi:osmotically-inducible protein OsmY
MAEAGLKRDSLAKVAGLVVGVMVGGVTGPIVFHGAGLPDPGGAALGSAIGGAVGFALVSCILLVQKKRRDRELYRAAEAVLREASLPDTIRVKVEDARIILEGEVDNAAIRQQAERVLGTISRIAPITNRIRLRSTDTVANPEDIKKRIQESLVRSAEMQGRGIQVFVDRSRVILAGKVRSWVEASEAEQIAWNMPGIAEVENRLEVA